MRAGIILLLAAALVAGILIMVMPGCGGNGGGSPGGQPKVVATTTMLGDAVEILLEGTGIESTALIKPGVDPHLFELQAADAKRLQAADLVIYNGFNLEGKMSDALEKMNGVAVADSVPEGRRIGATAEGYSGTHDPHVWMDVGLWAEYALPAVADALKAEYPDQAATIDSNLSAYQAELVGLDNYVRQAISLVPEQQRILITAHDAFGYFGQAYAIEVQGVQGLSTTSEAGTARVSELVNLIVDRKIPAVFVESSVPQKYLEKLVEGVEAAGHTVELAPAIFSDSTGPAGKFEGTYAGMIDHNATIIAMELGAQNIDLHGHFGKLTLGHDHGHEDHAGAEEHDDHEDHDDHEGHDHDEEPE